MIRSLFFIILLLLSLNTSAEKTIKSIIVIGDSLSAAYGIDTQFGWVNLLAVKITQSKKPYQVINASISGDTTINGVKRLLPLLKKYQPGIVILVLGANDGLRGQSLKVMKKNLSTMIDLSLQYQSKVLLVGMKIPPNYGKRYTDTFYRVYEELAKKHKLSLIPFLLEGVGGNPKFMQSDGLHPTGDAQPIIMNTVWGKLRILL